MASYASRLRQDIAGWVRSGLIDEAAGTAILREVETRERRAISFGTILLVMAALLVGAAILVLVAANWQTIPRLGRVGSIFTIISACYVGGAMFKLYGHGAVGEALWLVGAAAFGGAIALIGQMYHLSGDENQAILVWCVGTAFAAAALHSGPLTVAATGLAVYWLFSRGLEFWRPGDFPHVFVALAAVLWLVTLWTRSRASRHLLLLSVVLYGVLLAIEYEVTAIAGMSAILWAGLFAICITMPDAVERGARLDGLLPVHCLLGFLVAMIMVQIDMGGGGIAEFAIAAAVAFAGIGTALVLEGRESRGLRWIAYLGFAVEVCLVYALMVGSMLGTAGFFLTSGVVLAVAAVAITRIEKRMSGTPSPAAGAA